MPLRSQSEIPTRTFEKKERNWVRGATKDRKAPQINCAQSPWDRVRGCAGWSNDPTHIE